MPCQLLSLTGECIASEKDHTAILSAINTSEDGVRASLESARERELVAGVPPLPVVRVGAGRPVAAGGGPARVAVRRVRVVGQDVGGQAVVHGVAGVVARAQRVRAVPLETSGLREGSGSEGDEGVGTHCEVLCCLWLALYALVMVCSF